ncbi:MAG: MFS transporter, partial [Proteobacteria bacterium]|nr:MFS transporter [Pseudomonadota bacterium]
GPYFPVAFGGIALTMAFSAMTNARLVSRLGMRRLSHTAIACFIVNGMALVATASLPTPPLVVFGPLLAIAFFLFGLTMSNLTAIALQPAGKAAGLASSLIGAATTAMGVVCGSIVGRSFDGSPRPLAIGFLVLGVCAFLTILTVEGRGGLFRGE